MYEVITNVDVFCFAVIRIIGGERLCAVVVCADDKRRWTRKLKLEKRLSKPDSLLNCTGESNILSFSS